MLTLPIKYVELDDQNSHPVITTELKGEKAYWIIDTGASKTVFDVNRKNDYNLLSGKDELHSIETSKTPVNASLALLKKVQFGTSEILNIKVVLIDLSNINSLYKKAGAPEICGLIGNDFLIRYRAVIDYKNAVLQLSI